MQFGAFFMFLLRLIFLEFPLKRVYMAGPGAAHTNAHEKIYENADVIKNNEIL